MGACTLFRKFSLQRLLQATVAGGLALPAGDLAAQLPSVSIDHMESATYGRTATTVGDGTFTAASDLARVFESGEIHLARAPAQIVEAMPVEDDGAGARVGIRSGEPLACPGQGPPTAGTTAGDG